MLTSPAPALRAPNEGPFEGLAQRTRVRVVRIEAGGERRDATPELLKIVPGRATGPGPPVAKKSAAAERTGRVDSAAAGARQERADAVRVGGERYGPPLRGAGEKIFPEPAGSVAHLRELDGGGVGLAAGDRELAAMGGRRAGKRRQEAVRAGVEVEQLGARRVISPQGTRHGARLA